MALLPVHGRVHANRLPASYVLPGCQLRRRLSTQLYQCAPLLQHTELEARINELVDGSVEDVLMLAR